MEWWKFNGYGFYVWGSYLMAFAVAAVELVLLQLRRKRALKLVEDMEEQK